VIEDALDNLATSRLDREERRSIENRLKEFRRYDGFTCQVEISFSHGRRTYIFDQQTDWFDEMNELIAQTEDSYSSPPPDSNSHPLGGFFSNN
jgi:hypothetical protein